MNSVMPSVINDGVLLPKEMTSLSPLVVVCEHLDQLQRVAESARSLVGATTLSEPHIADLNAQLTRLGDIGMRADWVTMVVGSSITGSAQVYTSPGQLKTRDMTRREILLKAQEYIGMELAKEVGLVLEQLP